MIPRLFQDVIAEELNVIASDFQDKTPYFSCIERENDFVIGLHGDEFAESRPYDMYVLSKEDGTHFRFLYNINKSGTGTYLDIKNALTIFCTQLNGDKNV